MKISMGLAEATLGMPPAAKRPRSGWERFALAGWTLARPEPGRLFVTDAAGLTEHALGPEGAAVCAGVPAVWPEEGEILCFSCSLPELAEAVNRLFSRIRTLETDCIRAVYAQQSIPLLTELLGPLLGGRLLALSMDFRVLGEWVRPGLREDGQGRRMTDAELLSTLAADPAFSRTREPWVPFVAETGVFDRDCLCVNVYNQHVPACRIIHIGEIADYPPWKQYVLRTAAEYVRVIYELSAGRPEQELGDRFRQLASELLGGGFPRRESVELALGFRGWPVNGPFLCAVILPADGASPEGTLPYYFRIVSRMVAHSYVLEDRGEAVCVIWLQPYGGTIDGFMARNVELLRDNNFLAGFSQVFTDFRQLASARIQARIALRLGLRLSPTIWYHRFSELALPYILDRIGGELEPEAVAAPELLRLREYDRNNGTEYLSTLRCYLRNSLNAAGTARELYIHRGTMNYRLGRIRELTGLDPEDEDTRLYWEISFRLLENRGKE